MRLPRCLKAWLREGLAETPTMLRLGVPTHPGPHSAQHQRHRVDGQHRPPPQPQRRKLAIRRQALRWCAAGMAEASKQFRRVHGHLHLAALRHALNDHVATETGDVVLRMNP